MWVEYERFDFMRGRVVKTRGWVDLNIVVQKNALLRKSPIKEPDLKDPDKDET